MLSESQSPLSTASLSSPDSEFSIPEETGPSATVKYCYNKGKTKKPKRNKSAFILFSIETRAKLKAMSKNGTELNSNQMMEKLANLWKELPKKEHERFLRLAENDKVRYQKELDEFWKHNPCEIIQNRTKKNHVKKPCSAYALFLKDIKGEIKAQYPKIRMADVLKIVSDRWKVLDEEEKNRYQERSDVEKEIAKAKLERKFETDQVKFKAPEAKKQKKAEPKKVEKETRKIVKIDGPVRNLRSSSTSNSTPKAIEPSTPFENQLVSIDVPAPSLEFKESALGSSFSSNLLMTQSHFYSNIGGFQPEIPLPTLSAPNFPQLESLSLMPQESKITITTDNLFPPEQLEKRASLTLAGPNLGRKNSAKNELLDLLNFDQKPIRLDSLEGLGKSSIWMDSNRFGSNHELSGAPLKDYAPKASRAEILNNAIMSALDIGSFGGQDDSTDFFNLGIPKFGL